MFCEDEAVACEDDVIVSTTSDFILVLPYQDVVNKIRRRRALICLLSEIINVE